MIRGRGKGATPLKLLNYSSPCSTAQVSYFLGFAGFVHSVGSSNGGGRIFGILIVVAGFAAGGSGFGALQTSAVSSDAGRFAAFCKSDSAMGGQSVRRGLGRYETRLTSSVGAGIGTAGRMEGIFPGDGGTGSGIGSAFFS